MPVRRRWLIGGAAVLFGLVGFAFWFAVLRDDAPPPVSLESAIGSIATPAPDSTATPTATVEVTSTPDQPALAGAWAVSSQGESFVGYRVKQTVAGVDAPTRVGRTPAVTASAEFSSDDLASMALDADLLQLTSGDDRRDAIFADLLETETFPTASFVLISGVPTEELVDASASVDVVAELTLHGVTRAITLTLEGETNGDLVVLVGSTEILFADFGIDRPTVLAVLSIEDSAVLELQLVLERG